MKLEPISNDLFTFEKTEKGFKLIIHKDPLTGDLLGLLGWVHQIGVNHPELEISIGAHIK